MTVKEFSKYVIDNMKRASLANALNITKKLDTKDGYSFKEFVTEMTSYVGTLLDSGKYSNITLYKLLAVLDNSYKMYTSDIKYNNQMIIDDLIISIWEILDTEV